jgi:peptide/nickel transport system substrate-binding protein
MGQRILRFFVTAALVLASLGAAPPRHSWTIPGTLRVALASSPNTLNPILTTQLIENFIASLIFDKLIATRPDGSFIPELAAAVPSLDNGGISRDGRTITIHLRRNVRWHDGQPFTSADVAFTQAARKNPANNVSDHVPYDRVVRLDTPDRYTVVVHLSKPYAPFLAKWMTAVLPAHLLAGKHDLNRDPFNAAPVGTGPFRFVRWERGRQIVLDANPGYALGKPGLQRVIVELMSDENSELIALRTHEIDWVYEPSPLTARNLGSVAGAHVEQFDTNDVFGLWLNVTQTPLDDVRVRRALAYAVDRVALVKDVAAGFADPAVADIPSYLDAFDPALRPIPYDPAKARAMLRAAGWMPGPDGILRKNGRPLALTCIVGTGNGAATAATIQIAAMLQAIGVDLSIKPVQANLMFAPAAAGGLLESGHFQLTWHGYFLWDDPDDSILYACSALVPGGQNTVRFCNAGFDRWTNVALTHYDLPTRKRAYAHTQRILLDQVPVIFVWWQHGLHLMSDDLHGVRDRDGLSLPYRWSL